MGSLQVDQGQGLEFQKQKKEFGKMIYTKTRLSVPWKFSCAPILCIPAQSDNLRGKQPSEDCGREIQATSMPQLQWLAEASKKVREPTLR